MSRGSIERHVDTVSLRIAYEESGPGDGIPVVLLHGFPDDVRAWDGVAGELVEHGFRTVVPYLRGFERLDQSVLLDHAPNPVVRFDAH